MEDLETRFWAKTDRSSECWVWTASVTADGYGKFRVGNRMRSAHRVAYEFAIGPIPEGLTIDHLCRVRGCINPDHLEAVTQGENVGRSFLVPTTVNAHKTECLRGHPFDDVNSYRNAKGHRVCRACVRLAAVRQRAKTP